VEQSLKERPEGLFEIHKNMKPMQTTIEEITPKKAEEYLSVNYNNRRKNVRKIATFVRLIKGGKWLLTHQGIAFNTKSHLIDGQNRLEAIKLAGIPVKVMVTRNIQDEIKNGVLLNVIDAIDRGQTRNVADILAMHHGVDSGYATLVTAMTRAITVIVTGYNGRVEAPESAAILDVYGDEINDIIEMSGHGKGLRNSNILAAFAVCYVSEKDTVPDFIASYFSGENLKNGSPIKTLRDHILTHGGGGYGGQSQRARLSNLALSAVYKFIRGEKWSRAIPNDEAKAYFIAKQERRCKKLIELFPKVDHKTIKLQLSPSPESSKSNPLGL
jgi:hypothetical protein